MRVLNFLIPFISFLILIILFDFEYWPSQNRMFRMRSKRWCRRGDKTKVYYFSIPFISFLILIILFLFSNNLVFI